MSHHPSDSRLTEYSTGSLAYGPAACISAHLEHCHDCTQRVDNLNLLGAAMLDRVDSAKCSDDLFDRVLDSVDSITPNNMRQGHVAANENASAKSILQALLPDGIDSVTWKRLAKGVCSFDLPAVNGEGFSVKLMRVTKGSSVFQHTHTGSEFTVCLRGGYSDELGSYAAGDFVECDSSHNHKPVAHRDQDCILLTAVEGKMRFTGPVTRLFNPLIALMM